MGAVTGTSIQTQVSKIGCLGWMPAPGRFLRDLSKQAGMPILYYLFPFGMQVGDAIWAEFNESEDHIVPYPKGAEDSTTRKDNEEEAASIAGITEHSAGAQTGLQGMEKQTANHTSPHFSSTRIDMESWPDLPSLNPTLDRNYSDDNIASTYLDFSAEPSLQKVTGNVTGSFLLSACCIAKCLLYFCFSFKSSSPTDIPKKIMQL